MTFKLGLFFYYYHFRNYGGVRDETMRSYSLLHQKKEGKGGERERSYSFAWSLQVVSGWVKYDAAHEFNCWYYYYLLVVCAVLSVRCLINLNWFLPKFHPLDPLHFIQNSGLGRHVMVDHEFFYYISQINIC